METEIYLNEKELDYLNLVPTKRVSYMTGSVVEERGGKLKFNRRILDWVLDCNKCEVYVVPNIRGIKASVNRNG